MENIVPKGSGPPPHRHPWGEAYYMIEGTVDFQVGGEPLRLEAGDFAFAPGGTIHSFQGVSDAPARMLVFDAPAHAVAFFEEVDRELRDWPNDAARLGPIAARHGIEALGAPAPAPMPGPVIQI
jgi:uncharacterized cupin superfamily protein